MALHACWSLSIQGCGLSGFYGRLWLRLVVAARYILLYVCLWLFICAVVSSLLALLGDMYTIARWLAVQLRCSLFYLCGFPYCVYVCDEVFMFLLFVLFGLFYMCIVATPCFLLPMWSRRFSLMISCPGTLVFLVVIFFLMRTCYHVILLVVFHVFATRLSCYLCCCWWLIAMCEQKYRDQI